MGRYLTKRMMFLLLTLIMLLPLLISSSSSSSSSSGAPVNSNKSGVSIVAREGRFPSSESELVDLEFEYLNVFHGKTCCSASLMTSASLAVQSLATYGEAVKDCLDLFEGIQSGTFSINASFCDRVFDACSDAYFSSSDATNQVIVPCGASKSIICGKASKWESNGTSFCYALGFTLQTAEEPCQGTKSRLEPVAVVKEPPLIKRGFQAFNIVAGFVLRTMLLNRLHYHQQMWDMIQRMREER